MVVSNKFGRSIVNGSCILRRFDGCGHLKTIFINLNLQLLNDSVKIVNAVNFKKGEIAHKSPQNFSFTKYKHS